MQRLWNCPSHFETEGTSCVEREAGQRVLGAIGKTWDTAVVGVVHIHVHISSEFRLIIHKHPRGSNLPPQRETLRGESGGGGAQRGQRGD